MPQYALLIYVPASGGPPPEERELSQWLDYTQAARDAGALVDDHALEMAGTARTVRVRDGRPVVTSGPFAETSEVLGGYYVLDVADHAEALRWAARIPSAPSGSVEVRPVMTLPEADCAPAGAAAA